MLIGFGLPVSGAWATPGNLTGFATRAEQLGYHSLWTFQRLLVGEDQQLDPVYRSVLDPLVSLAFVAAGTTRIRLGVAVVNFPYVSPAYLAKQAATLDVLSGGRLDLGLGTGWSPAEFTAVGTSTRRRGARLEEYLQVLDTLWGDGVGRFDGEFYTVPASSMEPKPVQRPGPPVLLGGTAPVALRRAGRRAAGWLSRSGQDLSRIGEDIGVVRDAAREAGRDPAALRVVCRGVLRLRGDGAGGQGGAGERNRAGERGGAGRARLSGSPAQVREDIAWLGDQGVTELFLDLNWDPLIGAPDADPASATQRAEQILHEFAPDAGAGCDRLR